MVAIYTARLSFKIYKFCQLTVINVFVWIWEHMAHFSLFNIKWLIYVTEILKPKAQWSLYLPPEYHSSFLRSVHWVYLWVLCVTIQHYRLLYKIEISTSKAQVSLNIKPDYHSTFLRFARLLYLWVLVWIWEQREINCLYNINWLVLITKIL